MTSVVFITGASSGIGRALAEHYARAGATLGLAARRADRLAELDAELRALGAAGIETYPLDVADAPALATAAYAIFFRERNRVDFYADAEAGLQRLAARLPVAALTNGNADLGAVGIAPLFVFSLSAREYGAAKPDAGLFHEACKRLGLPPHDVLHVGDDPRTDIAGAAAAGLQTCWIDRGDHAWPDALPHADLRVSTLGELADALDAHLHKEQAA